VTQKTKIREKFHKFWTKNQGKSENLVSKSQWQPWLCWGSEYFFFR